MHWCYSTNFNQFQVVGIVENSWEGGFNADDDDDDNDDNDDDDDDDDDDDVNDDDDDDDNVACTHCIFTGKLAAARIGLV